MKTRAHWALQQLFLALVFYWILPLAVRLPIPQGERLALFLGRLCAWRDLDWRTVALRLQYVEARTSEAYRQICGKLSQKRLSALVSERFETACREEWEGHLFFQGQPDLLHCEFIGLEAVRSHLLTGQGIVLLTAHFDAVPMGIVQLGLAGVKLNLMTSNVVEDSRVAPVVQRYFQKKYEGIERYLNGGRVMHAETELRTFYSAVRRGECVVILGDAPTANLNDALAVNFFGAKRAFAPGAIRIAEKMNVPVAAFVCHRLECGRYLVEFGRVMSPQERSHSNNLDSIFGFLEAQILASPGRWWAADQLPNFIVLDA
ncbi:MAG: lysophospholipid acyltransferase family protein [Rhodocyclaceae bacterium]|nr:lysophospholipid acyltransferase family protein [Rhodocyclaceae bacterium]